MLRTLQKKKGSIKTRIIVRVAVLITIAMAFMISSFIYFVSDIMKKQAFSQLVINSKTIDSKISQKILGLIENTELLSRNELMINSLIDDNGKDKYLPPLVKNFMESEEILDLSIVDFEGKKLYESKNSVYIYSDLSKLRISLGMGESTYYVDELQNHLFIISPIKYYDTVQGSLIAVFDLKKIFVKYTLHEDYEYVKFIKNDQPFFVHNLDENEKYYTYHMEATKDSLFSKLGISLDIGSLESYYLAPVNKAIVNMSLIGINIIILGIFLAYIIASSITNPILKLYRSVKDNEKIDLDSQYKPLGTNDEIEVLSEALFEKRQDLNRLNKTLEQQVIDRTQKLEKQMLIAESANKSKSQFLANISHEIRTPLNAMMGFIDILKESDTNKENQKYLDIINNSSKSLLDIINDILDFSKIESGVFPVEHIDFDAPKEFQGISELFRARSLGKKITLITNYDNIPEVLNGDVLRIKQIIHNLLSNAVKFTKEGKHIYLDFVYKEQKLFVSVKDEGIGISKEYQKNIFEAFSQEDASTTRKYGGTGLGLAISSSLVKMMGGELQVQSNIEEGSEFFFSIPIKKGKSKIVNQENKKNVIFSHHILVVEDNDSNQLFMKILLRKMGMTFDIAKDGLEAIDYFKKNKYDCILMDENMPNLNGLEATKIILELERIHEKEHTIIIALTANAIKGDREKFLTAGMDEYLTKPINREKLEQVFLRFLPQK